MQACNTWSSDPEGEVEKKIRNRDDREAKSHTNIFVSRRCFESVHHDRSARWGTLSIRARANRYHPLMSLTALASTASRIRVLLSVCPPPPPSCLSSSLPFLCVRGCVCVRVLPVNVEAFVGTALLVNCLSLALSRATKKH